MTTTTYLLLCASAAALTSASGCMSSGSASLRTVPSTLEARQPSITGSHKRIARGEIQLAHVGNALEAIRQLRPEFLAPRAIVSPNGIVSAQPFVYLNGVRQGSLEALQTIPVDAIIEIRYVNARAMREWLGLNHASDAIVVRTGR